MPDKIKQAHEAGRSLWRKFEAPEEAASERSTPEIAAPPRPFSGPPDDSAEAPDCGRCAVESLCGDVPLAHAMLAWNPLPYGDGRMVVIPHPDKDHWTDRLKLSDTTGACWLYWGEGTKQKQLTQLFIEAWHIACRDRVRLETIHAALMVIPEYRATLSGEPFFWSAPNSGSQTQPDSKL